MDEKKGRRKLNQLGIEKIGTLGILLKAKQSGLIEQIRPDVERLIKQSFSISPSLVNSVLRAADESIGTLAKEHLQGR